MSPALLETTGAAPAPHRLYWTLQLFGWSAYAIGNFLIFASILDDPFPYLPMSLGSAVVGLALTHGYRQAVRGRQWADLPLWKLALRIALVSAVLALSATLLTALIKRPIMDWTWDRTFNAHALTADAVSWYGPMLGWSLIYFAYHYAARMRHAEVAHWQLATEAKDAELRALRAQLDPHFLFNALNSVRALVAEEPGRAQEAVTRLSELLRYALRSGRTPLVSLDEEVEVVEHYLALEAMRFEERLQYRIEVDPAARSVPIPPVLLQTLVENAVKHGVAPSPGGGRVEVEARLEDGGLRLRVTNTAPPGGRAAPGGGVGLQNARGRLRLLYGEAAVLSLTEREGREAVAEVWLPVSAPVVEPAA